MSLQFQGKTIDLEKCRLTHRALQFRHPIQVMRIVPVDMPQVQIRPVRDAALRQVQPAVARMQKLHQRLDAVKQALRRIRDNEDAGLADLETIGLVGNGLLVGIERLPRRHTAGAHFETDHHPATRCRAQTETRLQLIDKRLGRHIARRHARAAIHRPRGTESYIAIAQFHLLRFGEHGVAPRPEARHRFGLRRHREES